MAHSNHYFRMEVKERHIDLLARDGDYEENNIIQLIVYGPVYGTTDKGEVGIWLTEEEQDRLIAGILERRGIHMANSLPTIRSMRKTVQEISATGNQQSLVHPAETH